MATRPNARRLTDCSSAVDLLSHTGHARHASPRSSAALGQVGVARLALVRRKQHAATPPKTTRAGCSRAAKSNPMVGCSCAAKNKPTSNARHDAIGRPFRRGVEPSHWPALQALRRTKRRTNPGHALPCSIKLQRRAPLKRAATYSSAAQPHTCTSATQSSTAPPHTHRLRCHRLINLAATCSSRRRVCERQRGSRVGAHALGALHVAQVTRHGALRASCEVARRRERRRSTDRPVSLDRTQRGVRCSERMRCASWHRAGRPCKAPAGRSIMCLAVIFVPPVVCAAGRRCAAAAAPLLLQPLLFRLRLLLV
eukprot:358975-Chlamydomonas_euryale.AAC.2